MTVWLWRCYCLRIRHREKVGRRKWARLEVIVLLARFPTSRTPSSTVSLMPSLFTVEVGFHCRSDHSIKNDQAIGKQCSRIRIYRFFSAFKKTWLFTFFLKWLWKKRKKSVAKILSSMMLTLLQKKILSLLNVCRNFGLKTPGCYGYV